MFHGISFRFSIDFHGKGTSVSVFGSPYSGRSWPDFASSLQKTGSERFFKEFLTDLLNYPPLIS